MARAHRDLVVIGGSAGGLEALLNLLSGLPHDFPAAILVVLHIPARGSGLLPTVIQRRSPLPVAFAEDGAPVPFGGVAIAPPDHHLEVNETLRVVRGARENRHRPAIDPLFRSAADSFGSRTVGVILSGSGSDGAAGMLAIRQRGGYLIVQQTEDALFPPMPQSVLNVVDVDAQLPASELAQHVARLIKEPVPAGEGSTMTSEDRLDRRESLERTAPGADSVGSPSAFSCPDCGGVLWQQHDRDLVHFRCRVGHAFSVESLLDAQQDTYEAALWAALRALEEKADLYGRMARQSSERGSLALQETMLARRAELEPHIEVLRSMLAG